MKKSLSIFLIFSFIVCAKAQQIESFSTIMVKGKTAKQIYDFMFSLSQEKYMQWHPEHKEFKIVKKTKDTIGSVFYFNEVINGLKVAYNWEIIELTPNKQIVMKAQFFIPILFDLSLSEVGTSTLVSHSIKIGYKKNITGLIRKVIKEHFFTNNAIKDLERHAQEEFSNLEWLIQN